MPSTPIHELVQRTTCPVVRVDRIKFMRIVDLTGLSEVYTGLRFEYDVHWLRQSTTTSVLRTRQGDIITQGTKFNDYYGFLTSMKEEDFAAKQWAEARSLKPNGEIVAETIVTITDTPVVVPSERVIARSTAGRVYQTGFFFVGIPNDWMLDDDLAQARLDGWNTPSDDFAIYEVNRLHPIENDILVWSSTFSDEENKKAISEIEKWRV